MHLNLWCQKLDSVAYGGSYALPRLACLQQTGTCSSCTGDLVPEDRRFGVALQLAKGVQQLHALNELHLDIKPNNVLVDKYGDVFLADFGISHQLLQSGMQYNPTTSAGLVGTPNYM